MFCSSTLVDRGDDLHWISICWLIIEGSVFPVERSPSDSHLSELHLDANWMRGDFCALPRLLDSMYLCPEQIFVPLNS